MDKRLKAAATKVHKAYRAWIEAHAEYNSLLSESNAGISYSISFDSLALAAAQEKKNG